MMDAPEFMTPEDGYEQLSLGAPFGDDREELDIFCRRMGDAAAYTIYVDRIEMGELMYDGHWYPLNGSLLTAKEVSIITAIIEQSEIKPPEPEPMSDEEKRLREWMTANDIHPGNPDMQAVIINSFYAAENEEHSDGDFLSLDEIDFDKFDLEQPFDHKEDEENEAKNWRTRIKYALNNLDNFMKYINTDWH
ncbi:hypothetical protein MTO98_26150 [Mucilaginibacter sp. SMC90]|uniref:hypothetical protein n=1 Tax=Mucilaginibacter sp. SMC90 TaxID=2929803 RepID=UPI001FB521C7|nr:hypothetical protein [Mucilaginibacter sp. SMC90]UOE47897.1 hypothetical protein MTO98_26150 [Mucilaginibacter sp. SMC90]